MGCKAACSCTAAGCGRVSAEPSGLRSAYLLGGLFLIQLNIRQHIFIQTDSLEVCFFFIVCVLVVVGLFDPEPHLGDKRFVFESEVSVNMCSLSLALFCAGCCRHDNLENHNLGSFGI